MRLIKFLFLTVFILTAAGLSAMPPHPDMVKLYQEKGELKSLMVRVEAINAKMNKNSPSKVFPSSGARKVPVLLVNFATPYTASGDIFSSPGIVDKEYIPFYGMFIISMVFFLLMMIKDAGKSRTVFKPLLPVYLSAFVFLISCGVTTDDEDKNSFPTDQSVYSDILNGVSSTDLSVRKYFQDMSNGKLNLEFDIYGPVKVSRAWEYYGENDNSVIGDDLHPGELVSEALRLMVSKYSSVNFSAYDNDNSGDVDSVIIIHQGRGEESGGGTDAIWSHQWDLSSAAVTGDGNGPVNAGNGVIFNIYTIQPEYTNTAGDSSMGVYAHEFGHVLGLPDIYDTSGETNGAGDWSLMASGSWKGPVTDDGTTPAPLLAWERFKTGGTGTGKWITVTDISGGAANQPVDDIESLTSREAFKVVLDTSQYILIEGKVQSSSAQWYVAGTGILISHIHEGVISYYTASDEVNAGLLRVHGVSILEADGKNNLWDGNGGTYPVDSGSASDLYTSGGIADIIKYGTVPPFLKSSGSATGIAVSNISVTASPLSMEFDVVP